MKHKRLIITIVLLFAIFGIFYFGVVRRISVQEFDAESEGFVRRDAGSKNTVPKTAVEPVKNTESNISAIEENKPAVEEDATADKIAEEVKSEAATEKITEEKTADTINKVPFTSQAPFAEWSNPVYQDGCEEAVSIMAMAWAKGGSLTRELAKKEMIAISDYEKEKFSEYRDASAKDTLDRIIKGYFGYANAEYKENITTEDIIAELNKGNLVITPMDGRKLGNPYYTPPGPERHMLLIIGYDSVKQEFITNDPGTKRGEGYRYSKDILFGAIRDYATGYHEPFGSAKKTMIVIKSN